MPKPYPEVVVAVTLSVELSKQLREFVESEHRSLRGFTVYLLEAMLSVAQNQQPGALFELRTTDDSQVLKNHYKVCLRQEYYDLLAELATKYGVTVTKLVRWLLWTGLHFHQTLIPDRRAVTKEGFVRLVVAELLIRGSRVN